MEPIDAPTKTSFWTTLPGILTAVAGLVAASATLIGVIVATSHNGDRQQASAAVVTQSGGTRGGAAHSTGGQAVQRSSGQSSGAQRSESQGGGRSNVSSGGSGAGNGTQGSGDGQTGSGQTGSGQTGSGGSGDGTSGDGSQSGGTGTGGGGASTLATTFVGDWRNDDSATNDTTHYLIAMSGGDLALSGYGKCSPSDCDWAKSVGGPLLVPAPDADDASFTIVWQFGFKTQTDSMLLLADGRLQVTSTHHYTDGRPDRQATQFFAKATS